MRAYLNLHNTIRNYDWGSHTALARIQGRVATSQPEAELWIGAHPAAPSTIHWSAGADPEPLNQLLERKGADWLGESAARFSHQLPFLLKILAAAQPLSLQVHPTRERAAAIFAEQPNGIYIDANHKPEVLCALTEFRALQGFRPFAEAARLMARLSDVPPTIKAAVDACTSDPSGKNTRQLLSNLLALDAEQATTLAAAVHRSARSLSESPKDASTEDLVTAIEMLYQYYPSDALVIAPLLLNVVVLNPGEALFTDAGTLHSYLEGTGIELMSTSDNVLRAGLTAKEINVSELLHVTRFEELQTTTLARETQAGSSFASFPTPAEEFELSSLEWQDHQEATEPDPREVQILLCTSGTFGIRTLNQDRSEERNCLSSGEALLVAARSGSYQLEGQGQLFRATVPT